MHVSHVEVEGKGALPKEDVVAPRRSKQRCDRRDLVLAPRRRMYLRRHRQQIVLRSANGDFGRGAVEGWRSECALGEPRVASALEPSDRCPLDDAHVGNSEHHDTLRVMPRKFLLREPIDGRDTVLVLARRECLRTRRLKPSTAVLDEDVKTLRGQPPRPELQARLVVRRSHQERGGRHCVVPDHRKRRELHALRAAGGDNAADAPQTAGPRSGQTERRCDETRE
mmetsp:Transcript_65477/g.189748  ORF Transcript_65477/g.189748 Transcript_65477/m.189748 type:complete len:225 (+) Transcript_65477:779-1453(+)